MIGTSKTTREQQRGDVFDSFAETTKESLEGISRKRKNESTDKPGWCDCDPR